MCTRGKKETRCSHELESRIFKLDKKDRKDYLNKQYYKQHKKTTLEQKIHHLVQCKKLSVCECTRKNMYVNHSTRNQCMYHRLTLVTHKDRCSEDVRKYVRKMLGRCWEDDGRCETMWNYVWKLKFVYKSTILRYHLLIKDSHSLLGPFKFEAKIIHSRLRLSTVNSCCRARKVIFCKSWQIQNEKESFLLIN